MKRTVHMASDEDAFAGYPLRGLLSGWGFRLREASPGHYIAEGTDKWGRKVSLHGSDQQSVLRECVSSAQAIASQVMSSTS